ncbi:MAG: hypothetical protein R6X02_30780 [Enhygromyxa sp.]
MLTLSACAEGCVHDRRGDPLAELHQPKVEELEGWLWPDRDDAWRPLAEQQLVALEQLVDLLIAEAETGRLSRAQRRRATRLAARVGVELRRATVEVDGRPIELWVVSEPADDRRGRGSYLIRLGPRSAGGAELLLQAPHSRFDRRTGALALQLLLEGDAEAVRAVFINSAHRYRKADGSRVKLERPEANPADAAHNPEHPLARATARVLASRELVLVQLHGFARSTAAGDPDLIVSSGAERPSRASTATVVRLRAALPEHPCGHHGVDTDRLGAHRNVQGHAARARERCFVHLELSEGLRVRLLDDRELRRRFARALPSGEELGDGCR